MRILKNILLAVLLLGACYARADTLSDTLNTIEDAWAKIYYTLPEPQQAQAYALLLEKAAKLSQQYPQAAGALVWQAVIKASYADHQDPLSALNAIDDIRALLEQSIALDPNALKGGAYVVLGTLYHLAPPWPVAFGDDTEAEKLLQAALKINPDGLDSNYYYGQFLLAKQKPTEAQRHFAKAIAAPIRPEQIFADTQLQDEAKQTLKNIAGNNSSDKTSRFYSRVLIK
jgi:tetratricopeptide (TPR) repeat protein